MWQIILEKSHLLLTLVTKSYPACTFYMSSTSPPKSPQLPGLSMLYSLQWFPLNGVLFRELETPHTEVRYFLLICLSHSCWHVILR